jgi:outer membrane receptor protein involved in Fe transport
MQIRFGVSRTVNRPDLREIGPVRFVDPETRYTYIGNPALEQATIDNADLRWEWYFGGQDNLQIALFYKDFSDPIEIEVIPGAPVLRRPFNAEAATNQGVELAIRKQLDFVDVPVVRDMYVKFNGAVIDSEVDLPQTSALFDSSGRALQGQSEWVVNAQLTWDDIERDIQASILFNWADERLVDVGTDNLPGAWEEPPPLLDFVYSQGLELFGQRYTVKLKAQNLIDEDVEVTRAGVVERAYNTGRTFSFGVSAEF